MWRRSELDNCSGVEELLEAHLDGDLEAPERQRVERHLEGCTACRRQLELAGVVRDELRALPSFDTPPAVIESVLETARAEERAAGGRNPARVAGPWSWWTSGRLVGAGLLAAAALAAAVFVPWQRSGSAASVVATAASPAESEVAEPPFDEARVRQAAAEARLALAYVSRASRRTGRELRDELIVEGAAAPAAVGFRVLRRLPGQEEQRHDET